MDKIGGIVVHAPLFPDTESDNKKLERILGKIRQRIPHVASIARDGTGQIVLPQLSAQDAITARGIVQQEEAKTPADIRREEAQEKLAGTDPAAIANRAAYRAAYQAILGVVAKMNEVIDRLNSQGATIQKITPRTWQQMLDAVKSDIGSGGADAT